MKASIFFVSNVDQLKHHHLTEEAESAEECLRKLQDRLSQKMNYPLSLTFRPHDGMIFCYDFSSVVPIGVLYREAYLPPK